MSATHGASFEMAHSSRLVDVSFDRGCGLWTAVAFVPGRVAVRSASFKRLSGATRWAKRWLGA